MYDDTTALQPMAAGTSSVAPNPDSSSLAHGPKNELGSLPGLLHGSSASPGQASLGLNASYCEQDQAQQKKKDWVKVPPSLQMG